VTRESALAEGVPGGFAAIYGEMSNLEMLGSARRGYFVEGLGGAQFALAGAVERLRSLPPPDGRYVILAATDPANPYGAAAAWPKRGEGGKASRRPSRTPGAYVMLRDGDPLLFVERGGRGILRLAELEGESPREAIGELAAAARDGVLPRLAVERLDREPVIGSGLEETLVEAGFHRQPRRLVASAWVAEGDTLHRLARRLERALAGRRLVTATAPSAASPLRLRPERLAALRGASLTGAEARGKHLLLHFDDELALHCHLGMSGSWRVRREG